MRKIWYLAFAVLLLFFLIIGASAISNMNNVSEDKFVGAYTYSSWIVQIGYKGDGIIYNKTESANPTSDRFTWTKNGNILTFTGAANHGAFMQRYLIQDGCLVGENGDITLVPYR